MLLLILQDPEQLLHELQEEEKEEQMMSKFYGVGSHTMVADGCVACNEMEVKELAFQQLYLHLCRMPLVRTNLGEQPLLRLVHAPLTQKAEDGASVGVSSWVNQVGLPKKWRCCVGLESRVRDKAMMVDLVFTFDSQNGQWVATGVSLWQAARGEQCIGAAEGQLP